MDFTVGLPSNAGPFWTMIGTLRDISTYIPYIYTGHEIYPATDANSNFDASSSFLIVSTSHLARGRQPLPEWPGNGPGDPVNSLPRGSPSWFSTPTRQNSTHRRDIRLLLLETTGPHLNAF